VTGGDAADRRSGGRETPGEPPGTDGADLAPGEAGRLYVVATPIGNLGDVTLRALAVLRAVPLVAAEDTRLTRRLFARHGVSTRLVSFHARNADARLPALLGHLRGGSDLALVTDAGTPGVSDPGEELVAAWVAEGGPVVPIPGPSAVLAAVVGSGIAGPRWSFEGFLPRSGRERRERLARVAADDRSTVLFEAPGRVARTLADLAAACGRERRAAVCRELTKLHEEFVRDGLGALAEAAQDGRLTLRGEFAIVVGPRSAALDGSHGEGTGGTRGGRLATGPAAGIAGLERRHAPDARDAGVDPSLDAALAEVERLVGSGRPRGDAAREVAAATGIPRRRLYVTPEGS
jgi:16S rRNA (cytidine1402-2'-O)-methyltransferase